MNADHPCPTTKWHLTKHRALLSGLFRPCRAEDRTIMSPGRVCPRVGKVLVKQELGNQAFRLNGVVCEQLLNLILLEHTVPDPDFANAAFEETAEVPGSDAHGRGATLGIDSELLIATTLFMDRTSPDRGPPIRVAAAGHSVPIKVRLRRSRKAHYVNPAAVLDSCLEKESHS